ncbi:hypothetical protein QBC35DRAFT_391137 [Podospora australis]|uniref:Uncharacterized protein n=1 Tax=Podospora australis TaxID=1536484 RepID=A0AAN7AEX7_9PEZI|nr:hypothetical protein QBC35DRAFT_391137 [Podospora australis]
MNTTNEDFASGETTTLERSLPNRLSRRSRSRTSLPDDSSGIPSQILYTPTPNNFDGMEQGFAAFRPEKRLPSEKQPQGQDRPQSLTVPHPTCSWRWFLVLMTATARLLAGRNQAVVSWLMFVATCLGILVAISSIFGWPILPLLRPRGRHGAGAVPAFGMTWTQTQPAHTTVINCYYCTLVRGSEVDGE